VSDPDRQIVTLTIVCHGRASSEGEDILFGLKMKGKEKGKYDLGIAFVMPEVRGEKIFTV
jgi:hypothetical protein